MQSRERVLAALQHREPDRVPIDINPVPDFYRKLKEYLGLTIDEPIDFGFMEEAIPHPQVLAALGADLISVKLGSAQARVAAPPRADLMHGRMGRRAAADPSAGRRQLPGAGLPSAGRSHAGRPGEVPLARPGGARPGRGGGGRRPSGCTRTRTWRWSAASAARSCRPRFT